MNVSSLHIRRATLADADVITANNVAMAAETEGRRLEHHVVASGVRRLLADPALGVYYVAERDGRVMGQVLITTEFSDWRDGTFWWIQSVYVDPAARRLGVYRGLYEHVREEARRAENVCGLRLYVDRRNATARATYKALGMQPTDYDLYEVDWGGRRKQSD